MEIIFELDTEKRVKIIGVEGEQRKEIGHIFTPSGSGHTTRNAIQVCGFDEAFDLWGCGLYGELEEHSHPISASRGEYKQSSFIRAKKDIQLAFRIYDNKTEISPGCVRCYTSPCVCENDREKKGAMPYNVKREFEIKDKLEYVNESLAIINEGMKED